MADNDSALAERVGDLVGGPANVNWVGSCTTRLRFVIKDDSKVDYEALNNTPGVLQALKAGGQTQVVIGTHVGDVRDSVYALPGWSRFRDAESRDASGGSTRARKPLDVVFDFLGGTFQPLIPAMTGASMVIVLGILLNQFAGLPSDSPTYLVLNAAGNAVFYFLPILVGFTASQKLGVNPFVGGVIAAALLHPSFTALGVNGDITHAFGLPLYVYTYAGTMFPVLLMTLAYAGLDRLLKRVLPRALQQIFVPTLEILILVPATALVFGPIGILAGNGIGAATVWLNDVAPVLFYVLVAAGWVFLVSMGIHWALISIAIADMASTGSSVIFGAGAGYQYAMMGVAVGILIKTVRDREHKERATAAAAATAVALGGITEPTIYGFVLRYRRALLIQVVSAGAAGLVASFFGLAAVGYAPSPILGLPVMQPILGAVITMLTAVVVPVVLINVFGYKSPVRGGASDADGAAPLASSPGGATTTARTVTDALVLSPLDGEIVPLAETRDPVFSGGLIGPGVAIRPRSNVVVAPADGIVIAAPATGHAIGIRTDDGTELLIHIGIDTVKLQGTSFTLRVSQGERVSSGQPLVTFDPGAITAAGYSLVTPVLVTNAGDGVGVETTSATSVAAGDPLFRIHGDNR